MTRGRMGRIACLLCAVLLLLPLFAVPGNAAQKDADLITDFNSLMAALGEAKDGDVLLVGDIDFLPTSPDIAHSYMSITVDKKGAEINLTGCTIENNTANHVYEGVPQPEWDMNRGGGIMLETSSLTMVNCTITGNRGSMGGAIYVEGNGGDTVTLTNCQISGNSAAAAYGGVYGYYTPNDDPSLGTYHLKLNLCTYENNVCDQVYDYSANEQYPWVSHPGDMFVNPYLTIFGCYVTDDTFASDFPHNDAPTADNGYNYLSATADEQAKATSVPGDAALAVIGDRYGNKPTAFYVGSNYAEALYKETSPSPPVPARTPAPTPPRARSPQIKITPSPKAADVCRLLFLHPPYHLPP